MGYNGAKEMGFRMRKLALAVLLLLPALSVAEEPSAAESDQQEALNPELLLEQLHAFFETSDPSFARVSYVSRPGFLKNRGTTPLPEVVVLRVSKKELNRRFAPPKREGLAKALLSHLEPHVIANACPDAEVLETSLGSIPRPFRRLLAGNLSSARKGDVYVVVYLMPEC